PVHTRSVLKKAHADNWRASFLTGENCRCFFPAQRCSPGIPQQKTWRKSSRQVRYAGTHWELRDYRTWLPELLSPESDRIKSLFPGLLVSLCCLPRCINLSRWLRP